MRPPSYLKSISVVSLLLITFVSVLGLFSSTRFTVHAAGASITLSQTSGPPTSSVTVSGTGYGPTENLVLKMDNTIRVGSAITDTTGAFSATFTIPPTMLPGHHTVYAASTQSPRVSGHAGFLVRTDWPMFGYDPQHSNFNPYENVLSPTTVSGLVLEWRRCLTDVTCPPASVSFSFPTVANGLVYMSGEGTRSRVWALNQATGGRQWSGGFAHTNVIGSSAVVNNIIYLITEGGHIVLALNATTGAYLWNDSLRGFSSSLTVANGMVYISAADHLIALDAITGAVRWEHDKILFESPVEFNGVVYSCSRTGTLYAFDANMGAILWKLPLGGCNAPMVMNNVVYSSSGNGTLYAVNGSTRAILWKQALSGRLVAGANGVVYVSSTDGNLYALDASTGAILRQFSLVCNVSVLACK